jgi:hypothetical protein
MLTFIQQFLALDTTWVLSPIVRTGLYIIVAVFLWLILVRFSTLPGNGGKYLWQLLLTPTAIFFTTSAIVAYTSGLGKSWAELLFLPLLLFIVCLALITKRLFRPHYPTAMSETDIEELAAITANAAVIAAETTKLASERAKEAAEHASLVADIAHKAALEVKLVAERANDKLIHDAYIAANKVEDTAEKVARDLEARKD